MERIITMGSVVQLKTNEKYMIIGHLPKSTYDNKQYDFVGCKYPAGLIGGLKMFNSEDDTFIKKVDDFVEIVVIDLGAISQKLENGEKEFSIPVKSSMGIDIIMDRIPVIEMGRVNGALGILHNRTEYTRLAEDLAGTRYLVDSMRANNHDFTNKLHVILGLLQMEMYDEAEHYIENITVVQRETISVIMHNIGVPSVAALLIGKNSRASELNVKFIFNKDSRYSAEDIYIPEDILITVIGNLIDNALEAMNSEDFGGPDKEICFGMYSSPGALLITVDDTGPGISEENIDHIFENGFTTKGAGHGTGLYQIKKLIESCNGTINVESQEGVGTSFTVSFTKGDKENV